MRGYGGPPGPMGPIGRGGPMGGYVPRGPHFGIGMPRGMGPRGPYPPGYMGPRGPMGIVLVHLLHCSHSIWEEDVDIEKSDGPTTIVSTTPKETELADHLHRLHPENLSLTLL